MNPQDDSTRDLKEGLDLSMAILALGIQIFHTSRLVLQPLEGLQLPPSGGAKVLLGAQEPVFGDW